MKPVSGTILWTDLTVPDASDVRDFYAAVVGWGHEDVNMGKYMDYNMLAQEGDEPAAGICHQRGRNSQLPAQWLIYVQVDDLDACLAMCEELGGSIIDGPRPLGKSRMCVIRDPTGACMGLVE